MEEKQALSELFYLEQELSEVMGRVTERVTEKDVRDGLEVVAQQHAQQANELGEALASIGEPDAQAPGTFQDHVKAIEREVLHARGMDGLFSGLADAERYDLRLHEHVLSEGLHVVVRDLIERQTTEERDHVAFLETRAPGMTPTIRGVGSVPKRGTAE